MTAERPNNIMCNVVEECQTVFTTIHAKIKLKVFFKMRFPSCMLVVFQNVEFYFEIVFNLCFCLEPVLDASLFSGEYVRCIGHNVFIALRM